MVLGAVVLAFVATALGTVVLLALLIPSPDPGVSRLRQIRAAGGPAPAKSGIARRPARVGAWLQHIVGTLGHTMMFRDATGRSKWQTMLVQGGYRKANAVVVFHGCRIVLALTLPAAFLLVGPHLTQWSSGRVSTATAVLVVAGFFLPHWWLVQRISRRQEEISDALPNALDLMVVCAESGLGLDATIQRLAQERQFTKHALSEEFEIVGQETRAGRPRSEALLALKDRVGLRELSSLVVTLVQAEKLGTGIGRSLRVHADSLRTRRRQKAEERAAKIPVKMVFPLVLLIFPATLLVLLGPSYILILKALSALKN